MTSPPICIKKRLSHGDNINSVEIDLFLTAIRNRYGYDFTHYAKSSLKRRLIRALEQTKFSSLAELLEHLLLDEQCFDEFLKIMSITVTEMFRNPLFYKAIREQIIPIIKTYPFVKIWHAGCATGQEVYSTAILLYEEGFLNRTRIYATDFNKYSLNTASSAIYSKKWIKDYADNYREAGGQNDFSQYFNSSDSLVQFKEFLKERTIFSYHNLVTDGVFGEMHLIFCRNVLIYFDKILQDQVLAKFAESLRYGGFLCLGNQESLGFSSVNPLFKLMDRKQRIYRKNEINTERNTTKEERYGKNG